jgi:hypothetical protein
MKMYKSEIELVGRIYLRLDKLAKFFFEEL